jgi:tripartite-type tricarboxylate transporter receptor subunit TctC
MVRAPFSCKYLFLFSFFVSTAAHAQKPPAQTYPSKTIRVIIPGTTGDTCDTMLRLIGHKFMEKTGYAFVMDNRPGAVGQIGLSYIAQAPADGYTIGCGQGGNMVIIPLAYKKVPYDSTKDFAPIALMASNFLALVVHPTVPFRNTRDLITYAKANPGKLTFASIGEGTFLHFATELFSKEAGFTYLHVPFKSVSNIVTDIIGGRIDAMLGSFVTVQPHITSGRLKVLGVAREKRAPNYPDIPTVAETVPGFWSGGWFGFIAPAGMARDQIALLNREMNAAMKLPDVREKMIAFGLEIHTESPEFFAQTLRNDIEKWGKLARGIGFKPQ